MSQSKPKRARTEDKEASDDTTPGKGESASARNAAILTAEERERRKMELQEYLPLAYAPKCPEYDMRTFGSSAIPNFHRCATKNGPNDWVCMKDKRLGIGHDECTSAPHCKHWPLDEEVCTFIHRQQRSITTVSEEAEWTKRRDAFEREDKLKAEPYTLTFPKNSKAPDTKNADLSGSPWPSDPQPNDPVVAMCVYRSKGPRLSRSKRYEYIDFGDILGISLEHGSGATDEWHHQNAENVMHVTKETRIDLLPEEHLVSIAFPSADNTGVSNRKEIQLKTSSARLFWFHVSTSVGRDHHGEEITNKELEFTITDTSDESALPDTLAAPEGECVWSLEPSEDYVSLFFRARDDWWRYLFDEIVCKPIESIEKRSSASGVKSLVILAEEAVERKWKEDSKTTADETYNEVQNLEFSARQKIEDATQDAISSLLASREANRVLELRSLLVQAEEELANKSRAAKDVLEQFADEVQANFDEARASAVKAGVNRRSTQLKVHQQEYEHLSNHIQRPTQNSKICAAEYCLKVYEPRMVPRGKRCTFYGKDEDGNHKVCKGAAITCGCTTNMCQKCHRPICNAHFVQHKKQCVLSSNISDCYETHCVSYTSKGHTEDRRYMDY